MYKNIIPDLVSFDTELNRINGFSLSDDFNFFHKITNKNKFHYVIIIKDDLLIPKDYTFRNGFYFKNGNCWFYERKFLNVVFKFKYDVENRIFYFNKNYSRIPFEFGGIYPVGRHISDFVNVDLFLKDNYIFRGCAFSNDGENVCIIAPGYNGKTSLLNDMLKKGAKYISEDVLVLNLEERIVYPSACFKNNYGRTINRELYENLKNNVVEESRIYDKLFLMQNITSTHKHEPEKNILDFLLLCSLFFLNNNFTRSFIAEDGYLDIIFEQIDKIRKKNLNYKYIKSLNFNLKEVLYGK